MQLPQLGGKIAAHLCIQGAEGFIQKQHLRTRRQCSRKSYALALACSVVFVLAAHLLVQWTINRLIWQEALNVHE